MSREQRQADRGKILKALRGRPMDAVRLSVTLEQRTRRKWPLSVLRSHLLSALAAGQADRDQHVRVQWSADDVWHALPQRTNTPPRGL